MTRETVESRVQAWIVPPTCQGQIVTVAYAASNDGKLWRRVTDASEGPDATPIYSVTDAGDCGCGDECNCWNPINEEPTAYAWARCSERGVAWADPVACGACGQTYDRASLDACDLGSCQRNEVCDACHPAAHKAHAANTSARARGIVQQRLARARARARQVKVAP